jgi:hypothetical protein
MALTAAKADGCGFGQPAFANPEGAFEPASHPPGAGNTVCDRALP